jgi:hypothetical protein
MPETPLLYERQRGESDEAFHAFTVYRGLGRTRSLDAVDRELREQRESQGAGAVLRLPVSRDPNSAGKAPDKRRRSGKTALWSRTYHWVDRASAWDDFLDSKLRERSLDEIEKMAKRQAQQAQLVMDVLMRPVLELAQALQDPNRAVALATSPLADLFELADLAASKLPKIQEAERTARGVRVLDVKAGATQGGTAVWEVEIHQPERDGPAPDFGGLNTPTPPEWDGDRARGRDDDE